MTKTCSRDERITILRELATPVDVDALIKRGVLIKKGAWYEVRDLKRLPANARRQTRCLKTTGKGPALIKFSRSCLQAQKLFRKKRARITMKIDNNPN